MPAWLWNVGREVSERGRPANAARDTSIEPVLSAVDVVKEYRKRGISASIGKQGMLRALDGVSFELLPGRTLGLVGESGCGKTTLAHVLLRLTSPTSGSVLYEGEDLFAMDRDRLRRFRRDVQVVFQDPEASLSPRLRAEDVIQEAWIANPDIVAREARHARVRELMDMVGLNPAHADRYPHQFSGGQRQRLGIARALAVEPRVVICDEPVSSLDVSVQAQIINLFQELQRELGVSYLFIAHDLAVVRHIADTVAVMQKGRIVESGPTDDVYDHPSHPYTRKLLAAIPLPEPPPRDPSPPPHDGADEGSHRPSQRDSAGRPSQANGDPVGYECRARESGVDSVIADHPAYQRPWLPRTRRTQDDRRRQATGLAWNRRWIVPTSGVSLRRTPQ